MPVVAAGFSTAANNGSSVVAAVVDGPATGSIPTGTSGAASTNSISVNAAGQYVRVSGSFLAAPTFAPGQVVTAAGFSLAANNGESTITAVTATVMTVTKTTAPVLEAGTTGSTSLGATLAGYTRPAGSFITDGFVVGQTIVGSGFAAAVGTTPSNSGTSVITAISADGLSMSVTKATGLAVEAAAAARELRVSTVHSITAFGRLDVTKAGGTAAEAAVQSLRARGLRV